MRDVEGDPGLFLIGLSRARVRWLLIGRQALIHYGVPAQTLDYDVWVDPMPANVKKFLRVASALGLTAPGTAKELESRPLFSLFAGTLKVDVFKVRKFTNLDGETIDFASAYRRRVIVRVKGDPLAPPIPSIRDLKTLKRMRDGASDREDLRYLNLLEKRRTPRRPR